MVASTGITEVAKRLIDAGAAINARAWGGHRDDWEQGVTPLFIAAARGHANVVKLLLSRGADDTIEDDRGRTPLQAATDTRRVADFPDGEITEEHHKVAMHLALLHNGP